MSCWLIWPRTERWRSLSSSWTIVNKPAALRATLPMSRSTPQMCVSWSRRCVYCSHIFHTQKWHFSGVTVTNCGVKRVSCGSCRRRERRRQTDRSLTDCSDSCAFQPRPEHQPVSQVKHTHINVPPNGDFTGRKHHSPESGRPWLWQLSPHFWRFRCSYSLV